MVRLDTGKDRSSYAEGSLAIQIQINAVVDAATQTDETQSEPPEGEKPDSPLDMINAESVGQAVDPSTVSTTMESVEGTEDPETSVTVNTSDRSKDFEHTSKHRDLSNIPYLRNSGRVHQQKFLYDIRDALQKASKKVLKTHLNFSQDVPPEAIGKVDQSPFDTAMPSSSAGLSITSEGDLGGVTLQDASNSGMPVRQPFGPPETLHTQKFEGFVRFLKGHVSPNHNRVTAGGRIVPAGPKSPPPTFHREFIETLDSVLLNRGRAHEVEESQSEQRNCWTPQSYGQEQTLDKTHGTENKAPIRNENTVDDLPSSQTNQPTSTLSETLHPALKVPEGSEILHTEQDGKVALVLLNGGTPLSAHLMDSGETIYVPMQQITGPYSENLSPPQIHSQMAQGLPGQPVHQAVSGQQIYPFDSLMGYPQATHVSTMGQAALSPFQGAASPIYHHPGAYHQSSQADMGGILYHEVQQPNAIDQQTPHVSWPNIGVSFDVLRSQLSQITHVYSTMRSQLNELEKFHALHDTTMPFVELEKSLNHKKAMIMQLDDLRRQKDTIEHTIRYNIHNIQKSRSLNFAAERAANESKSAAGNHQSYTLHHTQSFNTGQQMNSGYRVWNVDQVGDSKEQTTLNMRRGQNVKQLSPNAPAFVPKAMVDETSATIPMAQDDKSVKSQVEVDPTSGKKVRFVTINELSKYQEDPVGQPESSSTATQAYATSELQETNTAQHAQDEKERLIGQKRQTDDIQLMATGANALKAKEVETPWWRQEHEVQEINASKEKEVEAPWWRQEHEVQGVNASKEKEVEIPWWRQKPEVDMVWPEMPTNEGYDQNGRFECGTKAETGRWWDPEGKRKATQQAAQSAPVGESERIQWEVRPVPVQQTTSQGRGLLGSILDQRTYGDSVKEQAVKDFDWIRKSTETDEAWTQRLSNYNFLLDHLRQRPDAFSKRVVEEAMAAKTAQLGNESARLAAHNARGQAYKAQSSIASPTFQAAGAFANTSTGATMSFLSDDYQKGHHRGLSLRGGAHSFDHYWSANRGHRHGNSSSSSKPHRQHSYEQSMTTGQAHQAMPTGVDGEEVYRRPRRPQHRSFPPNFSYGRGA